MTHIEHLLQLVKNHKVPSVLALGAEQSFFVEEGLKTLRAWHNKEDPQGLNCHRFSYEDKIDIVINNLKTPPFLSPLRLVELHGAEKLNSKDCDQIVAYIDDSSSFSVLVMVFNKIDKRNKLLGILENKNLFYGGKSEEKDTVLFMRACAKEYGIYLDAETEQFLLIALDNDLHSIKNTVIKLSLTLEGKLSFEQVSPHVNEGGLQDVFKLARHMSEGDTAKALKMLARIRYTENALKFLGVLAWQFRVLVHIRHCLNKNMNEYDIKKAVSVYGDRFPWMLRVARQKTTSFHIGRLTRLLQCDLLLKSQKIRDPFNLIERLVYQNSL